MLVWTNIGFPKARYLGCVYFKDMTDHWVDRSAYPFTPNYFYTEGNRMHYIDEGQGETVLFVHGTPSWSFEYRGVIKRLKTSFRCVAIDHIGFGLSDKPVHYDYSTANHSQTLERFVLDKNLNNFALVVHDFGGPIGLNFAIRHPDRVKRLVILNSWLWSSDTDPDFVRTRKLLKSPILPFLYRHLNFSARYILPRSFGDQKISKEILKQYTKPFAGKTPRNGPWAFVQSLLSDQDWFEQLWEKRQLISRKPTLFVWGMKDPIIKPDNLKKFQSGFPNSVTVELDTGGHFPQEEHPELVADAIMDFLSRELC